MSPEDTATDNPTDLIVRCQRDRTVHVRLCDRFREGEDCVHYAVEASAPGFNARVGAVAAWDWDTDLTPFLDKLAADFRGWNGERTHPTPRVPPPPRTDHRRGLLRLRRQSPRRPLVELPPIPPCQKPAGEHGEASPPAMTVRETTSLTSTSAPR